jgi:lipopolysaccharide/colanic/teichoic acid biosynthesis glycosyltransferase
LSPTSTSCTTRRRSRPTSSAAEAVGRPEASPDGPAPATGADLSTPDPSTPDPSTPDLSTPYLRWVKPALDRVGAAVLLVVLLPVLLALTALVRLRLGPGVLYRQQRVGRDGEVFEVYKFRTMEPDRRGDQTGSVAVERRQCHKREDDPRHTSLGRFLRRWSLDELPQLLNVLQGRMSLVGPRPELVDVVEQQGLLHHPRHLVRPGVTGSWQVSPRRSALLHEGVDLDVDYLARLGFLTDTAILLRTVVAVARRAGT